MRLHDDRTAKLPLVDRTQFILCALGLTPV